MASEDWEAASAFSGEVDGSIRGFAAMVPEADHALVAYLHVEPDARGRGLGGQLLDTLESAAVERGCRSISTCGFPTVSPFHGVDARDTRSQRFMEGRGYRQVSRSLHRVRRLGGDAAADLDVHELPEVHELPGYRLHTVTANDPDYWVIRRGIVTLCAEGEPAFAMFANAYQGSHLDETNAQVAVALHGETLVGFCGLNPRGRTGLGHDALPECGPLLVHPRHRGRGIAAELHALALSAMARLGCTVAVLGTDARASVVALHDRLGFRTEITWIQYERTL